METYKISNLPVATSFIWIKVNMESVDELLN